MERYSLRDAQDHLQQLIYDAQHGKTVLILDENEQAVQLVPVTTTQKPRKAGSARGLIKMAADFDAPLADFGNSEGRVSVPDVCSRLFKCALMPR